MVVCVVTGLMVGDRRFTGATILGVQVNPEGARMKGARNGLFFDI